MAEIKSSLEIALERARALGGGADGHQAEGEKQGQALARRFLLGEVPAGDLAARLAALPAQEQKFARPAAAGILLAALAQGQAQAVEALAAVAGATPARAAVDRMQKAAQAMAAAAEELNRNLGEEMIREMAQAGISGPAARPNPLAARDYEARLAQAQAAAKQEIEKAGKEYQERLG